MKTKLAGRKARLEKVPDAPQTEAPEGAQAGQNMANAYCAIREPELRRTAEQALGFLLDAHAELVSIHARLLRGRRLTVPPEHPIGGSLEEMLRALSWDAACLVGELRTISGQLG